MNEYPSRPRPTMTLLPVGVIDYVVTEPCTVGDRYVRTGDVICLLDGPHVELAALTLSAPAQRRDHGRVLLEQTHDGPTLARRPGARLIPISAADALPLVPAKTAPSRA